MADNQWVYKARIGTSSAVALKLTKSAFRANAVTRVRKKMNSPLSYHQNVYAAELDKRVTPGCRWLDLGAGVEIHRGWNVVKQEELAKRAARLVGCDLHGGHLAMNIYLTERVSCPAHDTRLDAGSFDIISANMLLEHLDNPLPVFKEVRRLLAPRGVFVFVTPNRSHPIVSLARLTLHSSWRRTLSHIVERRNSDYIFPTFYRANTVSDLRRLLDQAELQGDVIPFLSHPFTKGWLGKIEHKIGKALGWHSNLLGVCSHIHARVP
jgi:SAM-dependent methyltransferase